MIACFFGINGHVATVVLEKRRTVNSEWYMTICLPEVIGEIRKKQKNRREEAVDAFKTHVLESPQSDWKKCFENWFKRMQKCIDHHGEYFEKQ